jgi:hypothetical protein
MAVPVGTDVCYPEGADWLCAYSQDELDAMIADPPTLAIMQRSEALAWSTLAALTGYRLSICPTLIRPCLARCGFGGTWDVAPVSNSGSLQPFISGGNWYNACGCRDDCSCASLCEVLLPMGVGDINYVALNGVNLDPTAYRVDNGYHLVRTDGDCWPTCQDMTAAPDAEGSFLVSYYPGVAPNDLFRYAAGVLAVEYYHACTGGECRLPSGVESITRQGMTMTMTGGTFPGGMTGIPEVDAVIRVYNPYAAKSPARVLSPDRRRGRVQTWES